MLKRYNMYIRENRPTSTVTCRRLLKKLNVAVSKTENESRLKILKTRIDICLIFGREANLRNGMPIEGIEELIFPTIEELRSYKG